MTPAAAVRCDRGPSMDDVTDDTPTLPSAVSCRRPDVAVGGSLAGRYQRARPARPRRDEGGLSRLRRAAGPRGRAGDRRRRRRAARAPRGRASTREAQVTGRLGDHPNIITVYDTGEHDGVPYLVLRAMRGGSLADRARARAAERSPRRSGSAGEIAPALAHAHAHGVVHRDVKPDNVWLAADGTRRARRLRHRPPGGAERLTAEGIVVGTVRYLSPEQIRGEDDRPRQRPLRARRHALRARDRAPAVHRARTRRSVLTQHLTVGARGAVAARARRPAGARAADPRAARQGARAAPGVGRRRRGDAGAGAVAARGAAAGGAPAAPRRRAGAPPAAPRRAGRRRASCRCWPPARTSPTPRRCTGCSTAAPPSSSSTAARVERYLGDALVGFFGLDRVARRRRAARRAGGRRAARRRRAELRLGHRVRRGLPRRGGRAARRSPPARRSRPPDGSPSARRRGEILLGERHPRGACGADATIDAASGRLLELRAEQPALLRAAETPFVGRARELDELHAAFARARDERAAGSSPSPARRASASRGSPASSSRRSATRPTVLAGRCLAYGEGTTYRALADIVRGLGDDPRAPRRGAAGRRRAGDPRHPRRDRAVGRARAGRGDGVGAAAAARAPRARPAARRRRRGHPLGASPRCSTCSTTSWRCRSGSPILLVCLTRPELLETRPAWAAPQPDRSVLRARRARRRRRARARRAPRRERARRRGSRARAEGNPLFVEQLVAVDAGQDDERAAGEHPGGARRAHRSPRARRADAAAARRRRGAHVSRRRARGAAARARARAPSARCLVALAAQGPRSAPTGPSSPARTRFASPTR